jgi:hypothetical protein
MVHDLIKDVYWYGAGLINDEILILCNYVKAPLSKARIRHAIRILMKTDAYYEPSHNPEIQFATIEHLTRIRETHMEGPLFMQLYGNLVHLAYIYDVVRKYVGVNAVESSATRLEILMERLKEMAEIWNLEDIIAVGVSETPYIEEVISSMVHGFHKVMMSLHDLLFSLHDEIYRMQKAHKQMAVFKEELVQRTWHPKRMKEWCLDTEEYRELFRNEE